jgi:hypothetical protein
MEPEFPVQSKDELDKTLDFAPYFGMVRKKMKLEPISPVQSEDELDKEVESYFQ